MCLCVCCVVCVRRVQNVSATPATLKAVEVQRPRRPRGCWVRQLPRPQPHSSSAGPGQGHGGPRAAWLRPPRCHLRGFVGDDLPCAGDPVRAGRRSRGGAARTVRVPRYPARGLHAAPTPMQRLGGFSHDPPPPSLFPGPHVASGALGPVTRHLETDFGDLVATSGFPSAHGAHAAPRPGQQRVLR